MKAGDLNVRKVSAHWGMMLNKLPAISRKKMKRIASKQRRQAAKRINE